MKRTGLAVALAALGVGASPAVPSPELPSGSLYREPLQWTSDSGAAVALADFRGETVALSMFYSECSSVCLCTLGKLREIEKAFAQRGMKLQIVLVSYDSLHDTKQRLARFRHREALPVDRWHLLSGSPRDVSRLAQRIGLGSYVDAGEHIVHAYRIVLLDEEGLVSKTLDASHNKVASLFER